VSKKIERGELSRRELQALTIIASEAAKTPDTKGIVQINDLEKLANNYEMTLSNLRVNISRLRRLGYVKYPTTGCVALEEKGQKALRSEIEKAAKLQKVIS